ncbi:hypothetical protein F2Q70_00028391 [Brassica cretica]|uniref:Uncharacterized protein n=1 Tax=Brassica cretica TaxID=69181 RepID=A0A3N6SEN6_BRACR|nr:hypothetical protein F2Q70_00028391 [Brassica cretica]KAF3577788.1 hypothetical protein DY000_02035304 [Brassica cretica]
MYLVPQPPLNHAITSSLAVASPEASGDTKLAGYLWKPGEYGITIFISRGSFKAPDYLLSLYL